MPEAPAVPATPEGGDGSHASMNTTERRRAALMVTRELPITGTHIGLFLTRERTRSERYGVALGATLGAALVTAVLAPWLDRAVFVLLWPAVLLSALVGGVGPAALSSVLAVIAVHWTVLGRPGAAVDARDVAPMAIFLATSLAMSSVANGKSVV